jgi:hypothetical protein
MSRWKKSLINIRTSLTNILWFTSRFFTDSLKKWFCFLSPAFFTDKLFANILNYVQQSNSHIFLKPNWLLVQCMFYIILKQINELIDCWFNLFISISIELKKKIQSYFHFWQYYWEICESRFSCCYSVTSCQIHRDFTCFFVLRIVIFFTWCWIMIHWIFKNRSGKKWLKFIST